MTVDKSLAVKALSPTFPASPAVRSATAVVQKKSPLDLSVDFDAVIDTFNPLQHLPIVSSVYRELSGDQIGLAARAGGGFLYGGPIGLAIEAASAVFETAAGDTPAGLVKSAFVDDKPASALAAASPSPSPPRPFPWMTAATRTA